MSKELFILIAAVATFVCTVNILAFVNARRKGFTTKKDRYAKGF